MVRAVLVVVMVSGCTYVPPPANEAAAGREAAARLRARDKADADPASLPAEPWMKFVTLVIARDGANDAYHRDLGLRVGTHLVSYGVYPIGTDGRVLEPVWDTTSPRGRHPATGAATVRCAAVPARTCTLEITSPRGGDRLSFTLPEAGIGEDRVYTELANAIVIGLGGPAPGKATTRPPQLFPPEQTEAFVRRHAAN